VYYSAYNSVGIGHHPVYNEILGFPATSSWYLPFTRSRCNWDSCLQYRNDAHVPTNCGNHIPVCLPQFLVPPSSGLDISYHRSITTPHKLPYFKPIQSLRVLLTPTERRRPWIIYLTPGLLAAQVAHIGYVVLCLGPLRRLLLPPQSKSGLPALDNFHPVRSSIYFIIVLLSTGILTPLEVIATRLAIQRNHASAEFNSVSQEENGDAEDVAEFAGAEEDVIGSVKSRISSLQSP